MKKDIHQLKPCISYSDPRKPYKEIPGCDPHTWVRDMDDPQIFCHRCGIKFEDRIENNKR